MYPKTAFLLLLFASLQAGAQQTITRNPAIAGMVARVNADSLEKDIHQLVSFGTRHTLSTLTDKKQGIGAARNWVLQKFSSYIPGSGGRLSVLLDTVTLAPDGKRVDVPVNLGNVMATLKGTDPADKRVFIVSGHLDSRATDIMDRKINAPGANDDGSGVVALLEMVRIMHQTPFPATIIFVAVSGEEQGLLGADYLAGKAAQQGWEVAAMLNNDMIGQSTSNETNLRNNTQVRVFSEGLPLLADEKMLAQIRSEGMENDGRSRQLARYVKEVGERYVDGLSVMLVYRSDRFLRGGDHLPFLRRGFPAVRITDLYENYTHQHQDVRMEKGVQYGDLPQYMDFEYLRKNTCLNLAVLANLADAPSMPQAVKMEVKELTNSTRISWQKPAYGRVKGYYVLLRETSHSTWEKKFFTTAEEIALPYSKDNYFFAVQAIGENDTESLAAFAGK
jgi:hypothetical protein